LGGADGAEAAWETTAAVRATGTGGTSSSITGSLSNASGSVTAWGATAAVRAFGTGGSRVSITGSLYCACGAEAAWGTTGLAVIATGTGVTSSSATDSLCTAHFAASNGTTVSTLGRYISRIRSTFRAACASGDRSGITGSLCGADVGEAAWGTTGRAVRATGTGGSRDSITCLLYCACGGVAAWGTTGRAVRATGTGVTSSSGTGSLCTAHFAAVNGTTFSTLGRYISRIRSTLVAACASGDRSGITGSLCGADAGVAAWGTTATVRSTGTDGSRDSITDSLLGA